MYSTIAKIIEDISEEEFIHLLNDESRPPEQIVLDPADPEYDESDVVVVRGNKAIIKASEEIDSYLRGRFNLPLTETPSRIEHLATEIAIYYLYERRHRKEMPESVVEKKKLNDKYLLEIQKGHVNPGIPDEPVHATKIIKGTGGSQQVFTDDVLEGF